MPKKSLLFGLLTALVVITGVVVVKSISRSREAQTVVEEVPKEDVAPMDTSVSVQLVKSKIRANTVVVEVSGMAGKYTSVAYELTYESQGLIKGVNSGSKPIDVSGKDAFEREVYLGTCSKNDCKPDLGVKKISVTLEFTDTSGKKSQFSKDYEL
ncbi:hypothetical protein HY950_02040 [Candidatus Gottesmanbacteria bacterium]|nr:hypothetical protein [Candidatus Gottesmanbacteria bacterium]